MSGALYTLSALPLLALAIRCWGRWARAGGWAWAAAGVLLAAVGTDALRLLLRRAQEAPSPWALQLTLLCCGGFLLYVLLRTWQQLGRRPRRPRAADTLAPLARGTGEGDGTG